MKDCTIFVPRSTTSILPQVVFEPAPLAVLCYVELYGFWRYGPALLELAEALVLEEDHRPPDLR
jgi:hypothetical protein